MTNTPSSEAGEKWIEEFNQNFPMSGGKWIQNHLIVKDWIAAKIKQERASAITQAIEEVEKAKRAWAIYEGEEPKSIVDHFIEPALQALKVEQDK